MTETDGLKCLLKFKQVKLKLLSELCRELIWYWVKLNSFTFQTTLNTNTGSHLTFSVRANKLTILIERVTEHNNNS